jgi:hypothetical protein
MVKQLQSKKECMKHKLILGLIIIMITACNLRQTHDFEVIDLSISHERAQKQYSLKVYQDGKAYIKTGSAYFNSYKEKNYVFTLNKNAVDTISLLTRSIVTSKFDSVYYTDCLSCINYNLIIKTKENKFHFFHIGDLDLDSKFKLLEDYVIYLTKLIDRSVIVVDSSFKFESWTDRLFPPPPPLTMTDKLKNE